MPLQPIEVTAASRAEAIARQITNTLAGLSMQLNRLRRDQPATEATVQQTPQGPREIPAQPAVTKAEIDAKLGAGNVAVVDAIAELLG